MVKRITLILCGWLAILLGVIGVFLPIMPTTPFILVAAWCFARSSRHFHQWLLNNRFFGPIVRDWEAGLGIPVAVRNYAVTMVWVSMFGSMWLIGKWWGVLILTTTGLGVSIYLWRLPIKQPPNKQKSQA